MKETGCRFSCIRNPNENVTWSFSRAFKHYLVWYVLFNSCLRFCFILLLTHGITTVVYYMLHSEIFIIGKYHAAVFPGSLNITHLDALYCRANIVPTLYLYTRTAIGVPVLDPLRSSIPLKSLNTEHDTFHLHVWCHIIYVSFNIIIQAAGRQFVHVCVLLKCV